MNSRDEFFSYLKEYLWWRIADSNCLLCLARAMCSQLAPIPPTASHAILVGALRFEQRRSKTNDLQSSPDTVTGLNTLKLGSENRNRTYLMNGLTVRCPTLWPSRNKTWRPVGESNSFVHLDRVA